MKRARGSRGSSRRADTDQPAPKPSRSLTIIAQDPTVRVRGRILTARVQVPNEQLSPGPRGYRLHVVDYDATTNRLFRPLPRPLRWAR